MTSTQKKNALIVALGLAVGVGLFLTRQLYLQESDKREVQRRLDTALAETRAMRAQRDNASQQLIDVTAELQSLKSLSAAEYPEMESALEGWLNRVQVLKTWLEKMPDKRIPQMSLLTEEDWLEATKNAKVDTELDAREALATLRRLALQRFGKPLQKALSEYASDNGGNLPSDPRLLAGYFDPLVPIEMLQNFEVREIGSDFEVEEKGGRPRNMISNTIVDDIFDTRIGLTAAGTTLVTTVNLSRDALTEALKAYHATNNGQEPMEPGQLTPFLKRPIDPTYLQKYVENLHKPKS